MDLADAGPSGNETRGHRARDLVRSLLTRSNLPGVPISIVALYNGAQPVVIDTIDPEVVANVLDDLPLEHAFSPGKTTLYEAITACGTLAQGFSLSAKTRPQPWPPGQARLVIVSDGDSVVPTQAMRLPPAFAGTLVIGVGDPARGMSIAGHLSRQESTTLRQLAGRFGGWYHDGNRRHVPTELLGELFPARGEYNRAGLGE
jgi:Ca-activated chloride channel family protein